ncbi:MAG: hypothetical protein IT299_11045 [Dehalococcoidia bacterium]|nr:hypothetical protein [Dehalococcoidia bacterium]
MSIKRWLSLTAVVVAMLALATACSSSDDKEPTATATAASAQPQTVTVTATEFGIESSMTEFHVGTPYHFVVTNSGQAPHEVMLMQPMETGMMSMTEMDKMAVAVVEEDDLGAGQTYEFDLTFDHPYAAGELEFACHIPGHYESGMHTAVTVQ